MLKEKAKAFIDDLISQAEKAGYTVSFQNLFEDNCSREDATTVNIIFSEKEKLEFLLEADEVGVMLGTYHRRGRYYTRQIDLKTGKEISDEEYDALYDAWLDTEEGQVHLDNMFVEDYSL